MKEWFLGLNQRERIMVAGGGAILLIMMLYLMIWEPVMNGVKDAQENVVRQEKLLGWMQDAGTEVKRLRGSSVVPGQLQAGQSLLSLIDSSAKTAGLGNQVKRVKPEGDNKVRIWLDDVAFDEMVKWLENLAQKYGVQVESTVIDKANMNGRVNASLVLQSV